MAAEGSVNIPERRPEGKGVEVLVATDFSEGAWLGFERLLQLPLARGAQITLLHVLAPSRSEGETFGSEVRARKLMSEWVNRANGVATAAGREVTVWEEVRRGRPWEVIGAVAAEREPALVVIGRHGRRGFANLLIGSTAERVVRCSVSPVLVVHSTSAGPYERPMLAVDLDGMEQQVAEAVLPLLDPTVRELAVVHAFDYPFEGLLRATGESQERINRLRTRYEHDTIERINTSLTALTDRGIRPVTEFVRADPREAILQKIREKKSDLVCLGTRSRSAVETLLVGSVAETVVRSAPCDVLVTRPR
jgi:nucleotide-binding universal stress UspA family protein